MTSILFPQPDSYVFEARRRVEKMKRRPDRLTGMRISLGRRVIEPESFVSSSCVGDQFQNFKRHRIEKTNPAGVEL
jgi:hypothetical protein